MNARENERKRETMDGRRECMKGKVRTKERERVCEEADEKESA